LQLIDMFTGFEGTIRYGLSKPIHNDINQRNRFNFFIQRNL